MSMYSHQLLFLVVYRVDTNVSLVSFFVDAIWESKTRMSKKIIPLAYGYLTVFVLRYHLGVKTTQEPSYLGKSCLVLIWFRMVLMQIITWENKRSLTLTYPPNNIISWHNNVIPMARFFDLPLLMLIINAIVIPNFVDKLCVGGGGGCWQHGTFLSSQRHVFGYPFLDPHANETRVFCFFKLSDQIRRAYFISIW
jgi:hypothetical protein